MSPGYRFNIKSKGEKSRSQGHKVQKKHISIEGDQVAGVSLHSIECRQSSCNTSLGIQLQQQVYTVSLLTMMMMMMMMMAGGVAT